MGGYLYGEIEPKERCPFCNALCCADFVDIGVGYQQCGPYVCERCGASEIGPHDEEVSLSEEERKVGWYGPGKPLGSSVNVDPETGKRLMYFEADTLYRKSRGVAPRYDNYGRLIRDP